VEGLPRNRSRKGENETRPLEKKRGGETTNRAEKTPAFRGKEPGSLEEKGQRSHKIPFGEVLQRKGC